MFMIVEETMFVTIETRVPNNNNNNNNNKRL